MCGSFSTISFNRAKESKKFYVGVKYNKSSDEHVFSASVTNECQAWLGQREPEEIGLIEYVKKKMFNEVSVEIELVSQAYLVYGEESVELSAVCKVSY